MSTPEEQAAQERFERGVSLFLQDRGEGNKEIENSCVVLAESAPDRTLDLILAAIGKAQEKWKRDWKFCFADTSSGLAKALCEVVQGCSDCRAAVPYLQELALSKVQAVVALGFSKDDTVIDWLLGHQVAGDEGGFSPKIASIGRIGGPKAARVLIDYITQPAARKMLSAIGNDAIAPLVDAFDQSTKSFETRSKILALKSLRALGWEPQTVSQKIWVAVVEQDRHQLELFGLPHLKQIQEAFSADLDFVEAATRQAWVRFRHECIEAILQNAQPALWLQLMKDGPCDDIAADLAAERGGPEVLARFAELWRSGRFLKAMARLADRSDEATGLLIRLATDASAGQDTRMSAAAWLLTCGHREAYQIVPALSVAIRFASYDRNGEWSMARWSQVTGISEELLACASKAFCHGVSHPANRRECEEAIQKLCWIKNAFSSAVLQRVAVMRDGEEHDNATNPLYSTVDLSHLRAKAQRELDSRQPESQSLEEWYRSQAKLSVPAKPPARLGQ